MDAGRRRQGNVAPPILTLLDLFEEHRSAFAYDWRTRFGMALSDVGDGMDWGEAWDLTQILAGDPTSRVASAINGWPHPWTWDAMVLADLYDRFVEANSKRKPKSYPRPWDEKPKKFGTASMTTSQMRALLDEHRAAEHESRATVVRPETSGPTPG